MPAPVLAQLIRAGARLLPLMPISIFQAPHPRPRAHRHTRTLAISTMCIGENSAVLAVHYLNAQLTALYENALHCLTHHPNAKNLEENKYSFALTEFFYGK
ncbi:hypothetical protein A0H81_06996 [Grifola frondosa]|uniref:Uncharacterized protein n=1 Tax=Grifola frondosa TaxID=5627 RepID=A0A1C7M9T8_GRIFR|nr:hypothetical protein A0H81_06996 [Grifola frondosa]